MTQFNEDLMKALARFLGPYDNNISNGPSNSADIFDRLFNRKGECFIVVKFFKKDKEFFNELIKTYKIIGTCPRASGLENLVHIYGATRDYENGNYGIVMEYLNSGNLEKYLENNWESITWKEKLGILKDAAHATNTRPERYRHYKHRLANDILNGRRPGFNRDLMPHCYESLMRNCWSNGKRNRPKAETLYARFCEWEENYYKRNSPFKNFRLQRVEPSGNGNGYF
ncbi:unnamed protein product [Rhizophagus irregularis]|nr:unnamed protein product [Rhizophagus irregularis]